MIIYEKIRIKTEQNRGVIKKNIIQTIRNKEMDRKEFLKYSGVALLGLVGLKGIVSLLSLSDEHSTAGLVEKSESRGFGSGKYGA